MNRKCESCGATEDLTYLDDDAILCRSCYEAQTDGVSAQR